MNRLPRFPVVPNDLEFLTNPSDFYQHIKLGIQQSKKRIVLASLYLGTHETELVALLHSALRANKDLTVCILLDYFRGTRKDGHLQSSTTILRPLREEFGDRIQIHLYHSPAVGTFTKSIVPPRFIEAFGLQHIKLYVFDDTAIVTGANLNKDYFENRQDRYLVIKRNASICDYFAGLVALLQDFSYILLPNGDLAQSLVQSPAVWASQRQFQTEAELRINGYTAKWVQKTRQMSASQTGSFVYPALQMPCFSIRQDEASLTDLLTSMASETTTFHIATSYFNLPPFLQSLIWSSKASFSILTSSPQANGFYNSHGVSKWIPPAYSYFELLFLQSALRSNRHGSVGLFEYSRKNWTWHAKGLFVKLPNSRFVTTVGSSNLNYRSFDRDLELQLYLATDSHQVEKAAVDNLDSLYQYSRKMQLAEIKARRLPLLLRLAARTLRKML
ncbi:CDP-diacylglycerol--glycerol-3-phosphate 3-phosphatidyltransferase [Kappamyces sp. JEL0829]|nr:CDP-diacylglycerol--glycerol-3-phosphate 3-phosphatidyltransferase [Kappamyces sp. JEL0829]